MVAAARHSGTAYRGDLRRPLARRTGPAPGPADLWAELGPALAAVRSDLRLVLPATGPGLAFDPRVRGPVAAASARGVRTRLLAEEAAVATGAGRAVAASAAGCGIEVRVVPRAPACVLVVDLSAAFVVRAPLARPVVLRDRDTLAVVGAFFDDRWESVPAVRGQVPQPDPLDRAVLSVLATGAKDEVAARRLGLSVRSLRRRIAVLLDRLGASSRFEAGVRAAELGWVADPGWAGPCRPSGRR